MGLDKRRKRPYISTQNTEIMKPYFSKHRSVLMAIAVLLNALLFLLLEQLETPNKIKVIELFFAILIFICSSMALHLKNRKKTASKMRPIHTLFLLDISIILYGIYLRTILNKVQKINTDHGLTLVIGIIAIAILGTAHVRLLKIKKRQ